MTTELDHIQVHAWTRRRATYEMRQTWCSIFNPKGFSVFFKRRLCEYRSIHISSLVKSEVKINNTSSISSTQEGLSDVSAFLPSGEKEKQQQYHQKKEKKKPHMEHEAVMVTFSLQGQQQNSSQHDSEFSLTVNAVALWKSPFLLQNVQRAVKDIPGRIYWSLRKRVQVKVLRNSVGVCELLKVCVILHRVDVYVEVSPASCLFPADSGIMQHYTHSLQTPPRVKNGSAVS